MSAKQKVIINIDEENFSVWQDMNLIDAMASIGKEIPHYCYHPKLSVVGNCRMCLVEIGYFMKDRSTGNFILDERGNKKVAWMPKPTIACGTTVVEGLHVRTDTPLVRDCRESAMEFLLLNHPLDCSICDQAGECRLQEFAADYGRGVSRFIEEKNKKPKRVLIGPRVMLDNERCILCSRCIRFCNEIIKEEVLGFIHRGSKSELACYPGKSLESNYSLNTVDICPVGALTSVDFRFKMRVWFLKPVESICPESSVGVNTKVWVREGKIYRITPRYNEYVNDMWMSDSGRFLYQDLEGENRLRRFVLGGRYVKESVALTEASALIKQGHIAYVGSAQQSVEEQFLLKKIIEVSPGNVYFVIHQKEGDGFLISEDRTPNLRGAFVVGLIDALPKTVETLGEKIESGEIHTLVVCEEDLIEAGLTEEQLQKVKIIYLGTQANQTTSLAHVLIPTRSVWEKEGTFINQQFRLQKFHRAIPGPLVGSSDLELLWQIGGCNPSIEPTVESVWSHLRREIPILKEISFADLPATGALLEAQSFSSVPFCEGPSLHFEIKQ